MTLIELTVVLMVMLTFLGMMFIGVRAWKRGSDRAACIMNIYQTQLAVRSFANMNGLVAGMDASILAHPVDVKEVMVGEDGYLGSEPRCPALGTYTFAGNIIPETGDLYLSCSLAAADNHFPVRSQSW